LRASRQAQGLRPILRLPSSAQRRWVPLNSNVRRHMPRFKDTHLKNISRIDIEARGGKHETHGWQFKVVREGKQQTKFFADSIFGSKDLSLAAAQEYRDETLAKIGDYLGQYISDALPASNTSGILGVHRSESIRKDLSIEEVWQCHAPAGTERKKSTYAFRISVHGEKGALYKAVETRLEAIAALATNANYHASLPAIARLIDTYLDILIYLDGSTEEELGYIFSVLMNKAISSTEKQELITGRIGQGTFRSRLEKLWRGKCSVTGATVLLNASHIKPWAVSDNRERLDPFNGLLLSPTYDRAFDTGLITFDDDGSVRLSKAILPSLNQLGMSETASVKGLHPFSKQYLRHHRECVFLRDA
jgi:putative restriction endonuclease